MGQENSKSKKSKDRSEKKVTLDEKSEGADIKISLPLKTEKVFSLKPGDESLPPDWKTLLEMPLGYCKIYSN